MSAVVLAPLGVIVFATIYWFALRHQDRIQDDKDGTTPRCQGCGCQPNLNTTDTQPLDHTGGD